MKLKWQRLNGASGHEAGRALLKELWREHFAGEMPEIAVTQRGKPYFVGENVHFSISHTDRHAFCCIAAQRVGIDAEECDRAVNPALARRMLSPAEFARWEQAENKDACLLRLWVLKESYAKRTGRGLGEYLRQTDLDPNDPRIQIIDGCYVAITEE